MSNTIIKYDGINPFEGQPTPFVAFSTEPIKYGKFWGAKTTISLSGEIYSEECSGGYSYLINKINQISSLFSRDFKKIEIIDNGNVVFSRNFARVSNFSFDEDKTVFVKPYSISLECYDDNIGNLALTGVLDPSISVSYSMTADGSIDVKVSGFAKAAPGASLQNAIDYVKNRTNLTSVVSPTSKILGYSISKAILKQEHEEVNRIEHSYSLDRTFSLSRSGSVPFLLAFSVDITYSSESGLFKVSINGTLSGSNSDDFASLKAAFSNLDTYGLCLSALSRISYPDSQRPPGLNRFPVSYSIEYFENERQISFSYFYDSDVDFQDAMFDYSITHSYDRISQTRSASINGTISSRINQEQGWNKIKSMIPSLSFMQGLCGAGNYEIRGHSVSFDKNSSSISVSANFEEKKIKNTSLEMDENFFDISESVQRNERVNAANIVYPVFGKTTFEDLNSLRRGSVSASVSGKLKNCFNSSALSALRNRLLSLCRQHGGIFLEEINISESTDGYMSGSATMSF